MAKNFLGVELFKAGTWTDSKGRKNTWTQAQLDDIVSAYNELKDQVHAPLKIGHNSEQNLLDDEEPAAGWIENVKRVGNTLIGDFIKVPDKLAKIIEEGGYRSRSVELTPDFEVGDKKYNWVLTGVALLGGKLPAVSGLADILALYARETLDHSENTEVVLFESEGDDDLEEFLEALSQRVESSVHGKRGAPQIRALQSALRSAISSLKRGNHEMDTAHIAKMLGLKDDATEAEIEAKLKAMNKPEEKKEHASEDNEEIAKLRNQVLELEQANAVTEATRVVDEHIRAGKLLPKQREFAIGYAQKDRTNYDKFIENQPNVVEFGNRGSEGNPDSSDFSKFEPTQTEIANARALGIYDEKWRVSFMKTKATLAGVELPADFK